MLRRTMLRTAAFALALAVPAAAVPPCEFDTTGDDVVCLGNGTRLEARNPDGSLRNVFLPAGVFDDATTTFIGELHGPPVQTGSCP